MTAPLLPRDERRRPVTGLLGGVRICLVFEHSLAYYTRILQEIAALQEAGATIQLLTSHPEPADAPQGMERTYAPLMSPMEHLPASEHSVRVVRIASNLMRNAIRPAVHRRRERRRSRLRADALRALRRRVDIFWVVDEPSLPTVMEAVRGRKPRVVYETLDLVPEYLYEGEEHRLQRLAEEARLVADVDAFITVSDSYAEYYIERYGDRLKRRPLVRNDMPATIAESQKPTGRPLRLLFLGALMQDRPVLELMDAMALATSDATLTFQGKNLLGSLPDDRLKTLGVGDRVFVVDPCPPDQIVDVAREYDVGIVALRGVDENERRASTTKSFTYMAAGLAILGSDLPGIARVVNEHQNGQLVTDMQPAAWAAAIDRLSALPNGEIDAMRQRSLDAAHAYAWDNQKPLFVGEFVRALGLHRTQGQE